jgi:outer membrane protein assembly complex protein YaeT
VPISTRVLKRVALALLIVTGLIGLLVLGVHSPWARRYIQVRLREEARQAGISIEIGSLRYNLAAGSAELEGVTLRRESPSGLPPFLTARRIEAKLRITDLLAGRGVNVSSSTLTGLRIHIIRFADGTTNLPESDPSKPPSDELPAFLISRLDAEGSLLIEDRGSAFEASLPAWKLNLTGEAVPLRHHVRLNLPQAGTVRYEGRSRDVDLDTTAHFNRKQVDIERLRIASGSTSVSLAGSLVGFARREANLDVDASVDIRPMVEFAGLTGAPREIHGNIDAKLSVQKQLSSPDVAADVSTRSLVYRPLGPVDIGARGQWSGASSTLHVQTATIRAPFASATANATWTGTAPGALNRANVRIERANLLALTQKFAPEFRIDSTASGTLTAEWRGSQYEAAASALRLTLARGEAPPAPGVLPLSGSIAAKSQNRRVQVEASDIQTLGAHARATIEVVLSEMKNGPDGKLSGSVEAGAADLKSLADGLSTYLGDRGEALRDRPIGGSAQVTVALGGALRRPSAEAVLDGTAIRYASIENATLHAEASYDPSQISIKAARALWNGAEINANGRVGLEGTERPLAFEARTSAVPISVLLNAAGTQAPVEGALTLTATGAGTLETPQIRADVLGTGLAAYGEPLGEMKAQAVYAGKTLDVPSLLIAKPDGAGVIDGTGSFDTAARSYTANLTAKNFMIGALKLPNGEPVSALVNLTAAGKGTLDSPAGTIDAAAEQLRIGGRDLGVVRVSGGVANKEAKVTATAPAFSARAESAVQLSAPYPMTARLVLSNTDLAKIPVTRPDGTPLEGNLSAEVRASGEIDNWRKGEAVIDVASARVETPAGPVSTDGHLRASYRGEAIEVERARLIGPKSSLTLEGRLPIDAQAAPGTIRYKGDFDLTALDPWIAERTGVKVAGTAALEGSLSGTIERMEPVGTLAVRNGSILAPSLRNRIENIQLDAGIADGSLEVRTLSAGVAEGRLVAQGAIPLGLFSIPAPLVIENAKSGPAKFTLEATGFKVESVVKAPDTVHSELSLKVEAAADKPDLNAIVATATFDQFNFNLSGIDLKPEAPPRISLRKGVVQIEQFALKGAGANLGVVGSLDLATRELRGVEASGQFDAALLGSLSQDLTATGGMKFQATASGTLADPKMNGFLEWRDGQIALPQPAIQASNVDMRIGLENDRVRIEQFRGDLNGGTLNVLGGFRIAGGTIADAQLEAVANSVYLDFPDGLQTSSSVVVQVRPQGDFIIVDGSVLIDEGSYTRLVDIQTQVLKYLTNRGVELVEERNELLSRIRYNVSIETREPMLMDNNLGELAMLARLRLVGSYYRPSVVGRVEIEEGGTLRLQERRYVIDQGTVSFVNEARIQPQLDLTARTQVAGREITMRIFSERDGMKTDLTSDDPNDTRADILALLLTGRTAEKLQGRELTVAGEQAALSLLAGSLTGRLSEEITNTVGLTSVRIEPSLISAEQNPTARLTVGQDLATGMEFIYSMNLTDSSDQIFILDYKVTRRFNTRATRQEDNTYRFDLQHDLRFGGPNLEARRRTETRTIGKVWFTGEPVFPEKTLLDKLNLKPGERYNFFKIREGVRDLESMYAKQNYLEASVRPRRTSIENRIDLEVRVVAGPKVEFAYEGWDAPGGLRDHVREIWDRGVFDTQRLNGSVAAIRGTLAKEGYLSAVITPSIRTPEPERKVVTFEVDRGERYRDVKLVFDGASGISSGTLKDQLGAAKLKDAVYTEPQRARDFLTRYYRQEGYLDAAITGPEYAREKATGKGEVRFTVEEGARYRFGNVRFEGAKVFSQAQLETRARISPGQPFDPRAVETSQDRIEEAYWASGYRDVLLDYRLEKSQERGTVDLIVNIQENQQSIVQEVQVTGNRVTSERFIRSQLVLQPDDVLNFRRTGRSRRNLYETGAFSSVDIRQEVLSGAGDLSQPKRVRLITEVVERTPFQIRYGGFFDTDRGPGFIVDFTNRNSLGSARVVGGRLRYDGDVHEVRAYFSQPLLRRLPLKTDTAVYGRRELQEAFITDRVGATLQQEVRLRERFILQYGYRFEKAHVYDRKPLEEEIPFNEMLRVAPLNLSLTRDSRDEVLDATRGSFASQTLEFSTTKLGSDLRFLRYFGQYFKYFGLTAPRPVPFGGAIERSRVIFATGLRAGLAGGYGGHELPPSERFFAGGGTTVRGFEQNDLGPRDFVDDPAGGNAVIILNNELRFPMYWIFDGVTFLDIGQVYSRISDINLRDLRPTAGTGLRLRTPYFVLRFDYGVKLNRRPGESLGRWFFSIGQAF